MRGVWRRIFIVWVFINIVNRIIKEGIYMRKTIDVIIMILIFTGIGRI